MIEIRRLSLSEVHSVDPIPSGFETNHVYRLRRWRDEASVTWTLELEPLSAPLRKRYDAGDPDEWLESYADSGPVSELSFVAAMTDDTVAGLLTYRLLRWNRSIWLMDIRVRPSQRQSGVGSALVRHVQDVARREKVRGVSVETQINNVPAVQFYLKHGFAIAGFNDHLYANDDLERQDVGLFLFWEAR